jgi:tryptophan-rich sensory protein
MKKFLSFVACIVIAFLAGGIGSFFTFEKIPNWYASLNKPSFNPPNWIFGPVWTVLYFMQGTALFIVWNAKIDSKQKKIALIFFFVQLILNALWSIVFFGLEQPLAAFVLIVVLWVCILITIIKFYKISKIAGILLIPYILWTSFASVLNFFIYSLN